MYRVIYIILYYVQQTIHIVCLISALIVIVVRTNICIFVAVFTNNQVNVGNSERQVYYVDTSNQFWGNFKTHDSV